MDTRRRMSLILEPKDIATLKKRAIDENETVSNYFIKVSNFYTKHTNKQTDNN